MRKKARIFVTDTGRNIDVTTGAERRLFNFFFLSVIQRQILRRIRAQEDLEI